MAFLSKILYLLSRVKSLNVFISSTCYDLSQIREVIKSFLDELGFTPILSEHLDFPVDPSKNTIDNCIQTVDQEADILVLIVGNRYGYQTETGKSITNLEFETARRKGIPIYIFIDQETLAYQRIWKENKNANFEKFVDSEKVFEFIKEVREDSSLWTFNFRSAKDIIEILRKQFSYLFKDALAIKKKFDSIPNNLKGFDISPEAIRILFEKGDLYELEFFIQLLNEEINKREELRNDFNYRILVENKYAIFDNKKLLDWSRERFGTILNLSSSIEHLFNEALQFYFGQPGSESDIKGLIYVTKTYGRILEQVILWAVETKSTIVNEEYEDLVDSLANLANSVIEDLFKFPKDQTSQFSQLQEDIDRGNPPIEFEAVLKLNVDNEALETYQRLFEQYAKTVNNME